MALIFEPIKPYFTFAKELKVVAPLVSYTCALHGVQEGLALYQKHEAKLLQARKGAVFKILTDKLTEVEKSRAEPEVERDFPNKREILKDFVLSIFARCIETEKALHEKIR